MRDGGLDFALTGFGLYGVWIVSAVVYLLTDREGNPMTSTFQGAEMTGGLTERQRRAIIVRDGGKCVRCGVERWGDLEVHHRQASGMGGGANRAGINDGVNLISLCHGCHAFCHGNVAQATRQGYICPSWASPAGWPVLWRLTRWRAPTDGGWRPARPTDDQADS